jgi:hypothetical protein
VAAQRSASRSSLVSTNACQQWFVLSRGELVSRCGSGVGSQFFGRTAARGVPGPTATEVRTRPRSHTAGVARCRRAHAALASPSAPASPTPMPLRCACLPPLSTKACAALRHTRQRAAYIPHGAVGRRMAVAAEVDALACVSRACAANPPALTTSARTPHTLLRHGSSPHSYRGLERPTEMPGTERAQ